MKRIEKNRENFLKYCIPDDIISKLLDENYTLTKIRVATKIDLLKFLKPEEIEEVQEKIKRQPIPDDVFEKLVRDTEFHCCFCWDITEEKPVIIHHIDEYNETQDNSYDNLSVLCLNHHGDVHTIRKISQQNFPKVRQQNQKANWIKELSEYRAGNRPAPGSETKKHVITVTNSPGAIVTNNQVGNNVIYNISANFSRVLTIEMKNQILVTLTKLVVTSVTIRFVESSETKEYVGFLSEFLKSNGYNVFSNGVLFSEIQRNEFTIEKHPSDVTFAKITIGSIV